MCTVCDNFDRRTAAGIVGASTGPVAQLVERRHGMAEVRGSTPLGSTASSGFSPWALGGVVAGEGCFTVTRATPRPRVDGSTRLRFVFSLSMAERDRQIIEALRTILGVGSLHRKPARVAHHLDQVRLTVSGRRSHHRATIPFMDRYLLPSAKRCQYESWRDALYEHEEKHPSRFGKGPTPCSVDGCEKPVRGRSLCRSHYYRATGY